MAACLTRIAVCGLLVCVISSATWAEDDAWAWPFSRAEAGQVISVATLPTVGSSSPVAKRFKAMAVLWIHADRAHSRRAVKDLIALYRRYRSKGLAAVVVATGRHAGSQRAARLAKTLKLPFPMLVDKDDRFRSAYEPKLYPATAITSKTMAIRYAYAGHRPDYRIAVERQIKAVLGLGPPPESIVDKPRAKGNQTRRLNRFEIAKRKRQRKRARRRFEAGQRLLTVDSLPMIFRLYRAWAALLDEPRDELLHKVAVAVRAGKRQGPIAALKKRLTAASKSRAEAQLWLGRALVLANKPEEAKRLFKKCSGELLGQCHFELALLVAKTDKAKAVEHCRRGYKLAFTAD